ncbi:ParB/RepB/Spo0J family partition protein [Kordiimonas sp.]|uniref:ParB/RepB/Spo0J family partition protein n=1 Tax=Kordiimonas sp. TaxID=1970157 RepID=UPI003A8CAC5B
MAKRKRLGGPLQDYVTQDIPKVTTTALHRSAPIAHVTGEISANAAFEEVSRELSDARNEGRLVLRLPLDSVETAWLMRDRAHPGTADDPDFGALLDSLRRNGQRNPIEVVDMGEGRYGLISGWRRLTALRALRDETGQARFGTVLAFLRQPANSEEAYVAMVEENEIRLGLSYYERARIVGKAVEAGAFSSSKAALQSLFASASRAKRSKIGSFLALYQVLGDSVRFPQALTERLGLAMAKIVDADETAGERLHDTLEKSQTDSPEAEQSLFWTFIETENASSAPASLTQEPIPVEPATRRTSEPKAVSDTAKEVYPGVYLTQNGNKLHLSGPGVDPEFKDRLEAWLRDGMYIEP